MRTLELSARFHISMSPARQKRLAMVTNIDDRHVEDEFEEHQRTYRTFLKVTTIFVAHVVVILLLLGWYFSDAFV